MLKSISQVPSSCHENIPEIIRRARMRVVDMTDVANAAIAALSLVRHCLLIRLQGGGIAVALLLRLPVILVSQTEFSPPHTTLWRPLPCLKVNCNFLFDDCNALENLSHQISLLFTYIVICRFY